VPCKDLGSRVLSLGFNRSPSGFPIFERIL
jgi:hypothetical protein